MINLDSFNAFFRCRCENRNVSCTSAHEGRQLLDATLPINVDQLFTLLFTTSKFYLDFNASRKTTDLVQTDWVEEPKDNTKVRKVNQTVNLTQAIGPKSSNVSETQVSWTFRFEQLEPVCTLIRLLSIESFGIRFRILYEAASSDCIR